MKDEIQGYVVQIYFFLLQIHATSINCQKMFQLGCCDKKQIQDEKN